MCHPAQFEDAPPPAGLDVRPGTQEMGFTGVKVDVFHVRLHALAAEVPAESSRPLVLEMQHALRPHGYQALLTTGAAPISRADPQLVVFQAPDPWPLLFVRHTNGDNLGEGLATRDIVRRLKAWARQCELSVVGAGRDWLEVHFRTLPKDMQRFAGDLYLMGVDVTEAGFDRDADGIPDDVWRLKPEDQEPLAPQIGRALGVRTAADASRLLGGGKELYLWWD